MVVLPMVVEKVNFDVDVLSTFGFPLIFVTSIALRLAMLIGVGGILVLMMLCDFIVGSSNISRRVHSSFCRALFVATYYASNVLRSTVP